MLIEFQSCSRANIRWKVRKYERDQNIRVDNSKLLDFKDVLSN